MIDGFEAICDDCVLKMKSRTYFPFKTGHLKFEATSGKLVEDGVYLIKFDGSKSGAPYVEALEEGSFAHNIPHAFGRPLPFGTYGRFFGMFHPGSYKHRGFIKNGIVPDLIMDLCEKLNGEVL